MGCGGRCLRQTRVLTWYKEGVLARRRYLSTAVGLGAPVVFLVLLAILNATIVPGAVPLFPPPVKLEVGIPRCSVGDASRGGACVSLAWGPSGSAVAAAIVDRLGVPPHEMRSFPSRADLVEFVLANPNTTSTALYFNATGNVVVQDGGSGGNPGPARLVKFEVMTNASDPHMLRPQVLAAVEAELVGTLMSANGTAPTVEDVGSPFVTEWFTQRIPVLATDKLVNAVQIGGGSFVFLGVAMNLIVVLRALAAEREEQLRLHLKTMGVSDTAYWASIMAVNVVLCCVSALITLATGAAVGLKVFTDANVAVSLMMLTAFGVSMVCLAFWMSTLVSTSRSALIVGILFLVVFMNVVAFLAVNSMVYLLYKDSVSPAIRSVLALFPPFSFAKLWVDIVNVTYGYSDFLSGKYIPGRAFRWADLFRTTEAAQVLVGSAVPPPIDSVYILLGNAAMYVVLAWWWDQVLASRVGVHRSWYFVADPRYWGCTAQPPASSDPRTEGQVMSVFDLRKTYKALWKSPVHAVNGLDYGLRPKEVLSVVGSNGSGKSTMLKVITGQVAPTSGTVLFNVDGKLYDSRRDLDAIRGFVSLCPQFDITWADLTGSEHVVLFHLLRGGAAAELDALVDATLGQVSLSKVKDAAVGSYSGGMRRRLSLALSLLGDEVRVWLCDEGTTGVDPMHTRECWNAVQQAKATKAVLWVTHSMSEADALGDRVVIISDGQVCAIGDSLSLKAEYGTGYHIRVVCEVETAGPLGDTAETMGASVTDITGGAVSLLIPQASDVGPICEFLERHDAVSGFQVSHTTLEEVFLQATHSGPAQL